MRHFPSPDIGMFGRRQRYARGHRLPVVIIGRADAVPRDDDVIVHDTFGADDIAPIGPCSCCTVRVALQNALRELAARRERQHFNRVLIRSDEDLGPILRTFAAERALAPLFHVEDHPPLTARPGGDTRRFVLREDAPLDWAAFSRFVTTLTALRGPDLLQVKGMLNVAGCRGPVVVQLLQHLAHQPVELQAWPDDDHVSRLTFTTRGIEESAVRGLFSAVRLAAPAASSCGASRSDASRRMAASSAPVVILRDAASGGSSG